MKILKDILYGARIDDVHGSTHIAVDVLCCDSREAVPFSCFIAITGTQVDGHDYIAKAVEAGACAVVCEKMPAAAERSADVTWVQVDDAREALGHMACHFYDNPAEKMKVVAVTGTNGKTTVVTLLHQLLRMLDRKAGLVSTVENRILDKTVPATHTTPDPIALQALFAQMVEAGCTHCFMEASSHAIDQHRLTGTKLAGAVFTNITHEHLDYHGDFNAYIKAKKTLFDKLHYSAFALVNADDRHHNTMLGGTRASKKSYGIEQVSDYKGRVIEDALTGLHMQLGGQEFYARLIGGFNASNLTACYAAACELGLPEMEALTHLSMIEAPKGRMQRVGGNGLVDYAHTPDALRKVLETLRALRGDRDFKIICVVGCGGDRDRSKRPVMAKVAAELSEHVVLTSDNPRSESAAAIIEDMRTGLDPVQLRKVTANSDRREAIRTACALMNDHDMVLVAGKGHEKYQEVEGERLPFDDVLELETALASKA
ncbi:MAG: UDP-N-acetylmuramoyl-L-alanyl-D-glutamate--2,6-diaminopimelate ligase [Flavobacteriales bacterium]|nr:UDP-N-acetylmuramoyl-L-alanyl-D-glutamate--2,6-diaminopimelate ligase [Flavobacteriales bacterium]